jgi:hypothetical protein
MHPKLFADECAAVGLRRIKLVVLLVDGIVPIRLVKFPYRNVVHSDQVVGGQEAIHVSS